MAVYVDDMYKISLGNYRGMKMSHLVADSTEELIEFVKKIGVNPKWIQYPNTPKEHFDICLSKRDKAIEQGAIEVDMRILCKATVERKDQNTKLELPIFTETNF